MAFSSMDWLIAGTNVFEYLMDDKGTELLHGFFLLLIGYETFGQY